MWPFVVFCDLSVFVHDGLWCKVQLLWILPYFVAFVTIMAFMVVQLGCSDPYPLWLKLPSRFKPPWVGSLSLCPVTTSQWFPGRDSDTTPQWFPDLPLVCLDATGRDL